jgi:hypothetical protein
VVRFIVRQHFDFSRIVSGGEFCPTATTGGEAAFEDCSPPVAIGQKQNPPPKAIREKSKFYLRVKQSVES